MFVIQSVLNKEMIRSVFSKKRKLNFIRFNTNSTKKSEIDEKTTNEMLKSIEEKIENLTEINKAQHEDFRNLKKFLREEILEIRGNQEKWKEQFIILFLSIMIYIALYLMIKIFA